MNEEIEYLLQNYERIEDLDDEIKQILKNSNREHTLIIYKHLPDILPLMKEPRILFPIIAHHLECNPEFYALQTMYFLIKEYSVEYDIFYFVFYEIITKQNIEKYENEILTFIKIVLITESTTLKNIMSCIKKLCTIAINISSQKCLEILHVVFCVMRIHPTCFKMVHEASFAREVAENTFEEYQPYLFEFNILSNGIIPIRKIIAKIRNEANKKNEKYDRQSILTENLSKNISDYI